MGRRGQTGAGGAVVSSLSTASGGTVKRKGGGKKARASDSPDAGVEIVFDGAPAAGGRRKPRHGAAGAASADAAVAAELATQAPRSSGWIGKTPLDFLREWCQKNNRKRPSVRPLRGPRGADGTMECFVPPGRKDGRPVKGSGFDAIRGIGDRPGDQYAALNVLHQVERARNLQQILAPEFREVWKDMDVRFKDVQAAESKAKFRAEQRKKSAARKTAHEKKVESATISMSTASRHAIEDALVGQAASLVNKPAPGEEEGSPVGEASAQSVGRKLVELGFARVDAEGAAARFARVDDALDYLCLTLDEEELPKAFAPSADVEVVQFYKASSDFGSVRVNVADAQRLADVMSCSRLASERAMKGSDGNFVDAAMSLVSTLTCLELDGLPAADEARVAASVAERGLEVEALEAIYDKDVTVGVGVAKDFPNAWCARVRVRSGVPGLKVRKPVTMYVVDVHGQYPLCAPLVYLAPEVSDVPRAQRRLIMRAAASHLEGLYVDAEDDEPVHAIHAVASFLEAATDDELFDAATRRPDPVRRGKQKAAEPAGPASGAGRRYRRGEGRRTTWRCPRPVRDNGRPRDGAKARGLAEMGSKRKGLPAFASRDDIIAKIRAHQVCVVSGATGSGKTTQVPQYILEDAAVSKEPISIVCTQPRRIAAMSVAERVAAERCERIGETVGYQVKLNVKKSDETRLVFCTTGVLLRQMQADPDMAGVTHVLVDEVHERSVETDFLLLLLRDVLLRRPNLRVVLMSATVDASKFASYFKVRKMDTVPVLSIPGRTFPVEQKYLEQAVMMTKYKLRPGDRYVKRARGPGGHFAPPKDPSQHVSLSGAGRVSASQELQQAEGGPASDDGSGSELGDDWESDDGGDAAGSSSRGPRGSSSGQGSGARRGSGAPPAISKKEKEAYSETLKLIDEEMVNLDLIASLVRHLDATVDDGRAGAILVFLPGVAEISQLVERVSRSSQNLFAVALHSALSAEDQSRVFNRPPKGRRKVICSTNIAETSVTVEDVQIVIDTCRVKEMSFDSLNGTSVLAETFASQAACRQRAGRAGRVSKGLCFRLVKVSTFENKLAKHQEPEIRRVALEHLVLNLLSIGLFGESNGSPREVLAKAMDPPEPSAVDCAVQNLVAIGALEKADGPDQKQGGRSKVPQSVSLTALGRHLSGLPVDARIGKLLVYGTLFGCLDVALTITATLSERSPFYSPRDKRDEAKAVRKAKFAWGKSDLLSYVRAYDAWSEQRATRGGYQSELAFCDAHFLSRKTLMAIRDVRSQLRKSLQDAGFGDDSSASSPLNANSSNTRVVSAVVCASLYPNVIRIDPPGQQFTKVAGGAIASDYKSKDLQMRARSGERVFLHPESINFDEGNYGSRWLAYFSKVKTTRVFIRDASSVSPYSILLFGGEIDVRHVREQLAVDGWVVFKAPGRIAVLVRELRRNLDALLLRKFDNPWMDMFQDAQGQAVNDAILRLIKLES